MTALQELIKYINENDILKNLNYLKSIDLDDKLTELLQKEKQQIIKAYIEASANLEDITKEAAEEYYKETYENK